MFKTFCLFTPILVLISWCTSMAQKFGDPKGFIITQNDTVAGFIKYTKQKTLHYSCQFRRSNSDTYQEYTPKDIK